MSAAGITISGTRYTIKRMVSLASSLSETAGHYARRALEAFVTENLADFVLFGGVSVEHAAKSNLARENPAFLAPDRQFKSAIALHRAADEMGMIPDGMRTIGGMEAIERVCQLTPSLRDVIEPARELIALRNGEAHLGAGDETQRRSIP